MADGQINSDIEELKAMQMQDMHDLKTDIQKLLNGQSDMQQMINSLIQSNIKRDNEMKILNQRVDELEQYTRKDDVIIHGLKTKPRPFASITSSRTAKRAENRPSHELETIESQVIAFLNEKDIVVSPDEISTCHPIPTKGMTRP